MSVPVIMTTLFVGGCVAIPTLGRWAQQVTEALAFVLAVLTVVVAILYLCDRWPDTYANPRVPVAMTESPFDD
jgi:thiol:disulfide interchange protein